MDICWPITKNYIFVTQSSLCLHIDLYPSHIASQPPTSQPLPLTHNKMPFLNGKLYVTSQEEGIEYTLYTVPFPQKGKCTFNVI